MGKQMKNVMLHYESIYQEKGKHSTEVISPWGIVDVILFPVSGKKVTVYNTAVPRDTDLVEDL